MGIIDKVPASGGETCAKAVETPSAKMNPRLWDRQLTLKFGFMQQPLKNTFGVLNYYLLLVTHDL